MAAHSGGSLADTGVGITVRRARADDLPQCRAIALDIFEHDFGYGYQPQYHFDIDDLQRYYMDPPEHALFVAVDDATGEVVGMAAIKHIRADVAPDAPQHLIEQYRKPSTAELVRVYTHRQHRRRGIARKLVAACTEYAASEPVYSTIFFHTDASYPGAKEFWLSQAKLLHDNREDPAAGESKTMFFEIPLQK
jgi:ribosomal protein S18 acetylase RimI-like enzyme